MDNRIRQDDPEQVDETSSTVSPGPSTPLSRTPDKRARGKGPRKEKKSFASKVNLDRAVNPIKHDPLEITEMFSSLSCLSRGDQVLSGTFVNNFAGYGDLLNLIYQGIKFKSRGKREILPRCLFNYYMYIVFYKRVLSVVRSNGLLSHDLESAYQQLRALGDLWVPVQVASYLEGIGNFTDPNGVLWKLALPNYPFRWTSTPIKGLYGHLGVSTDPEAYVCYSQLPMPFIYCRFIQVCLSSVNPGVGELAGTWSSGIEPLQMMDRSVSPPGIRDYDKVVHTEDTIGYHNWDQMTVSFKRKLQAIGWSENSAPYDMQASQVNLSHSTLRMAAEGMSCIRSLKGKVLTDKEFDGVEGSRTQMFFLSNRDFIGLGSSRYNRAEYLTSSCNLTCESQLPGKLWSAGYIFAFHTGPARSLGTSQLLHEDSELYHTWSNFRGSGFAARMKEMDPIRRPMDGLVDLYRHWDHHNNYGDTDVLVGTAHFASAFNTRGEVLRTCMEHAFDAPS